jgi:hypothetical protein
MIGVNKPLRRSNFGRTSDTERMIRPGRTVPCIQAEPFQRSRPGGFMHRGPAVSCIEARRADILIAGATFDFLAHPSCLGVVDPEFKTLDLICRLVEESSGCAELTDRNAFVPGTNGV